jgi:hypothetical protein
MKILFISCAFGKWLLGDALSEVEVLFGYYVIG